MDIDDEFDLVLCHCSPAQAAALPGAQRLFGEQATPVISPWLAEQVRSGRQPPLPEPDGLGEHD